jgi:opacity protein-like surface antigen
MKKLACLVSSIVGSLTVSLHAGPAPASDYKSAATSPPPPLYGTGFYMGLDLGANVYQDRGGTRTFSNDFGDTLEFRPKNEVGFFGGIKAGYVFGTGVFRPTVEGDFFYNGFPGGADFRLTTADGEVTTASTNRNVNTGAMMSNFIMRFAFDRFQPYVGAGVGIYFAGTPGTTIDLGNGEFSTTSGREHNDLAWDVVAGADYYFTPKMSSFIEYHYLDYTSSQIDTNQSRNLGQQLVGAGLRFHF